MRFNFNLPPPYPPGYEPVNHFATTPYSGYKKGAELVLDTGALNIHAGKYDPQEVARNLEREMQLAPERSARFQRMMSLLPWMPGDSTMGGDVPPIITNANTAAGIADAIIDWICDCLSLTFNEKAMREAEEYLEAREKARIYNLIHEPIRRQPGIAAALEARKELAELSRDRYEDPAGKYERWCEEWGIRQSPRDFDASEVLRRGKLVYLEESYGVRAGKELASREWAQRLRAAEGADGAALPAAGTPGAGKPGNGKPVTSEEYILAAMNDLAEAEARAMGFVPRKEGEGLGREDVIDRLFALPVDILYSRTMEAQLRRNPALSPLADLLCFNRGLKRGFLKSGIEDIASLLGLLKNVSCWALYEVTGLERFQAGHSAVEMMFAALRELVGRVLDDPTGELAKLVNAVLAEFAKAWELLKAGKYEQAGEAYGALLWDIVSVIFEGYGAVMAAAKLVKGSGKLLHKLSPRVAHAAELNDAAKGAKGAGGKAAKAADEGDGAAAKADKAADKRDGSAEKAPKTERYNWREDTDLQKGLHHFLDTDPHAVTQKLAEEALSASKYRPGTVVWRSFLGFLSLMSLWWTSI